MRRLALSFVVLALACQPPGEQLPQVQELSRQAAPSDTVTLAADLYQPATFDTVSFASEEHMLTRGAQVFEVSCAKCHGSDGTGGALTLDGRVIQGPSLRAPDWELAGWEQGIRQVIFTGTTEGMPHWGLEGLRYRDIAAVAAYVNRQLRQTPPLTQSQDRPAPTPVPAEPLRGYSAH